MKQLLKLALSAAAALAMATPVVAQEMHDHHHAEGMHSHHHSDAIPMASAGRQMSVGEVKKVDKDAGKITIKHGPLENLGMPGMTMAFGVKDPSMLNRVRGGDKVQFVADKAEGGLVLSKLEAAH